ncbi:MAG TPA: transglycosylase domain-containing protein [Candidatus Methylomirabilis sp.]|nr:transglycosylase domain-containing protein [Candidatus Methylomirabilis sp.]
MVLHELLAHIPSPVKRTVRHSREAVLRALHHRFSLHPAFSAAGTASDEIQLPTALPTDLRDQRHPKRLRVWLLAVLVLLIAVYETRTSAFQSWVFSHWATRLTFKLEAGPSPRIAFPESGPFDQRLGYTRIPEFERSLKAQGYRVTAQTQFSEAAARLASWGILPPYREPVSAGLHIRGAGGVSLYDSTVGHGTFRTLEEVPPLLVTTLLLIENRRLQEPSDPRENPVVDWPRLAKAGALYAGRKLGLPLPLEGGSTLATQLEKFQHSRDGRTSSPLEKLRQMISASLKVYREGTDTRAERREILLQYLNELPLSARADWGEVNGLGDGLLAWFGIPSTDLSRALNSVLSTPDKVRVYKHVLALLCATRSPTYYLVRNHAALDARVAYYTTQLQQAGVIDREFARRLRATPITFVREEVAPPARFVLQRKTISHLRLQLGQLLGESNAYTLDRLHLQVDSTLDASLQRDVATLFDQLRDRAFLARHGLIGEHLLGAGDPRDVVYSFLLLERTPLGNVTRVHTDTLDAPFDVNDGMKMELGSTAKLRTLAHYLELMAGLHQEFSPLDGKALAQRVQAARDPLTRWAATTLESQPHLPLEAFLQRALDRTYSANPGEQFFTGGGLHTFANYERDENRRVYSLREGLVQSVNLVYIRLMRDLVRFHTARLPYDADRLFADPDDPTRHRLLEEIAEAEAKGVLAKAYQTYRNLSPREVEARLLGRQVKDERHLAMLFFAWHSGAGMEALGRWLEPRVGPLPPEQLVRLIKAYGNPQLTLADFGFLLGRHPLEVWCAGEVIRRPGISWSDLLARSEAPRRIASAWLFKTRNRHAQDLRLRIRLEEDAFARMTPSWRRLGFPFEHLVPSFATAIGASSDRPDALAELMGIILTDGVRLPTLDVRKLRFAAGTPYETVLERAPGTRLRVMPAPVASILRQVMTGVVTEGTARRVAGAFANSQGTPIEVGGKTGSGDNRYKTFARGGELIASRPVSRTAAFAFYIGDRYVGVITASVSGKEAGNYNFTSSLPVAILGLLAPAIETRLQPSLSDVERTPPATYHPVGMLPPG